MLAIIYDRRGNVICKLRNKKEQFIKINCQECGGTGIWNFYPDDYNPTKEDLVCMDCKGTGKRFVDVL